MHCNQLYFGLRPIQAICLYFALSDASTCLADGTVIVRKSPWSWTNLQQFVVGKSLNLAFQTVSMELSGGWRQKVKGQLD
jgi:hypothetical protein